MIKYSFVAQLLFALFTLTSCKDHDAELRKKIDGAWNILEIKPAEDSFYAQENLPQSGILTFEDCGEFTCSATIQLENQPLEMFEYATIYENGTPDKMNVSCLNCNNTMGYFIDGGFFIESLNDNSLIISGRLFNHELNEDGTPKYNEDGSDKITIYCTR